MAELRDGRKARDWRFAVWHLWSSSNASLRKSRTRFWLGILRTEEANLILKKFVMIVRVVPQAGGCLVLGEPRHELLWDMPVVRQLTAMDGIHCLPRQVHLRSAFPRTHHDPHERSVVVGGVWRGAASCNLGAEVGVSE